MTDSPTASIDLAYFTACENFERVIKDEANDFFNSKFASLKVVLSAVTGALREQNLLLRQYTGTDDKRQVLHTRLTHVPSGEFYESSWELHPAKADPQGEASALTYARRYAILTMMGLVPEDDDGHAGSSAASAERQQQEDEQKAREQERRDAADAEKWTALLKGATSEQEVRDIGNKANTERKLDLNLGGGQTVRQAVQTLIVKFQAEATQDGSEGGNANAETPEHHNAIGDTQ